MSQNNEMIIIQILMMDVVQLVLLKKAMLEVEDLYLERIHALSVLSLNSLHLMTKGLVRLSEEMDSSIQMKNVKMQILTLVMVAVQVAQ